MAAGKRDILRVFSRQAYHRGLLKSTELSLWDAVNCGRGVGGSCKIAQEHARFNVVTYNSHYFSGGVCPSPSLRQDVGGKSSWRRAEQCPRGSPSLAESCGSTSGTTTFSTSYLSCTRTVNRSFAAWPGDRNSGPLPEPPEGQGHVRNNNVGWQQRPPPPHSSQGDSHAPPSRYSQPIPPPPRPRPQQPSSFPPPRGGVVRPKPQGEGHPDNRNPLPVLDQRRINHAISAQYVRLVTPEGHKVLSRWEALDAARKEGLDLVEVDGSSAPPVCKIMDYNKMKFQKRKKEKENKQKLVEKRRSDVVKEVRISSRTESRDLEMKADAAMKLLNKGYRVKLSVIVKRGDAPSVPEGLIARLVDLVKDVGRLEWGPKVSGHRMDVLVRPTAPSVAKDKKKATAKEAEEIAMEAESESDDEDDEGGEEDEEEEERDEEKLEGEEGEIESPTTGGVERTTSG